MDSLPPGPPHRRRNSQGLYSASGNKVLWFINLFLRTRKKTFSWFKKGFFVQKVPSPFRSGRTRKKTFPFKKTFFVQNGHFCSKWVIFAHFRPIFGHFGSILGSKKFFAFKRFFWFKKLFRSNRAGLAKKPFERKNSFERKKLF